MINLNKENFWNEMYQKYPLAMKDFCEWMDEYKKREFYIDEFKRTLTWDELFLNNSPTTHKIKFHNLPIAMQMGIWNEYIDSDSTLMDKCKNNIETFLNATEEGMGQLKSMIEENDIRST